MSPLLQAGHAGHRTRKYKDEIFIRELIDDNIRSADWGKFKSRVEDVKNRKYNAREMEELFK
jgi:hypothetical protein